MLRILLVALAALLVVSGTAAVLLVRGTELSWFHATIERTASDALGRRVIVGEPPYLRLGKSLELRVADIAIANADWAGPGPLATLKGAAIAVDLASLFSGPIVIESLAIEGLNVALATNGEGLSNLPDIASDAEEAGAAVSLPFLLHEARIADVRLTRLDGRTHKALELLITSILQRADDAQTLRLEGSGSLQGRSWTLKGQHSGLQSLVDGRLLSGRLQGSMDELEFQATYELPEAARLEDLVVDAELSGTVPPRIAELTPILETRDPLLVRITTSDIEPGIAVDATVHIGDLDLLVTGTIDRPGSGDGLDLSVAADAGSLPRLARALDLGETEEVPLTINGTLRRNGRRLDVSDFVLSAGEHSISGQMHLPFLPGTTDADVDLRARGPDYSFYQRLLRRPFALPKPYEIALRLEKASDERERVDAQLTIGSTRVRASGFLGDFPGYRNSRLELAIEGDDLALPALLVERELPDVPIRIDGTVDISETGRVTSSGIVTRAAGASLTIAGAVDTYPELDDLDAELTLAIPSLAATSAAVGLEPLGDVPASLLVAARGAAREVEISGLRLAAGGLAAERSAGTLRVTPDGMDSDLRLTVTLEKLPELLGAYAPDGVPEDRISFALQPEIHGDGYGLAIDDIQGPEINGRARLVIGRDLALDRQAALEVDLEVGSPGRFLPPFEGYTPPSSSLFVQASTRGDEGRIDATIRSATAPLLEASLFPGDDDTPLRVSLTGRGDELRVFGDSPYLPEGPLPYVLDGEFAVSEQTIDLDLRDLRIGESEFSATGRVDRVSGALAASVVVPYLDTPAWLASREDEEEPAEPKTAVKPSPRDRLISDTPLPLNLLDGAPVDVTVRTGPLGIRDPIYPSRSLVQSVDLRLKRESGRLTLDVTEMNGSRGTLTLQAAASRDGEEAAIDSTLTVRDMPLGIISVGGYESLPRHDLDTHLTARGASLREIAATLDGDLLLTGGSGTLRNTSVSFVTESFFEQLLLSVLPALKDRQDDMQIQCTVLAARARAGRVALDPGFVIRTERVDLSARGEVDLRDERIAIRFDNQARRGLGISAASLVNPYVQITGTLAKPAIGLDVAGTAIAGGAAVATGGLTVLAKPLYGRFLARKNPCEVALERWRKEDP